MKRVRKNLKIFHVKEPSDSKLGYDSYSEFVVAAETEDEARNTYPSGCYAVNEDWPEEHGGAWVSKDQVATLRVTLLGVADDAIEEGVILSHFCPG